MNTRKRAHRLALLAMSAAIFCLSPPVRSQGQSEQLDRALIRKDAGAHGVTIFGTGQYLTGPLLSEPAAIALGYVHEHLREFGLTDREGNGLYVEKSHTTADGVTRVSIGQRVGGLRVHTARLVATLDPQGRIVMVSGRTASARIGPLVVDRGPGPRHCGVARRRAACVAAAGGRHAGAGQAPLRQYLRAQPARAAGCERRARVVHHRRRRLALVVAHRH